jgi:imidazolonepropionase-like amidohydrolase
MIKLTILIVLAMGLFADRSHAEVTALVNAVVIDGSGDAPLTGGTVLIENGLITSVGAGPDIAVPAQARVIDLAGKTVMPGLADMHVHFVGGWDGASVDMLGYQRYLNALLYAGVTTIFDVANVEPYILQIRSEVEKGTIAGPRIYSVGALIDSVDPVWPPISIAMSSVYQAVPIVERQARLGVDAIKAYQGLSIPQLSALVQAASEKGLMVIVDQWTRNGSYDVVATGVGAIAHLPGRAIEPATLELIVEKQVSFITTLAVKETFARERPGNLSFLDDPLVRDTSLPAFDQAFREYYLRDLTKEEAEFAERYKLSLQQSKANAALLHEAGVMLVAGTDAPYPGVLLGEGIHRELELLVSAGLTPLEAISAATRNAAKLLKADDWGVLKPGKKADLIVVAGRPDLNISETRNIEMVMQAGRILDRESLKFNPARDKNFGAGLPVD